MAERREDVMPKPKPSKMKTPYQKYRDDWNKRAKTVKKARPENKKKKVLRGQKGKPINIHKPRRTAQGTIAHWM
jgi:hypothetical protein